MTRSQIRTYTLLTWAIAGLLLMLAAKYVHGQTIEDTPAFTEAVTIAHSYAAANDFALQRGAK